MLLGKHSKTNAGSLKTPGKFEDNHLWHSAFPGDTVLNKWPYFWAERMPKLNFCSVGTKFIPSHLSSELVILALNFCPTYAELTCSHSEVSPLRAAEWRGKQWEAFRSHVNLLLRLSALLSTFFKGLFTQYGESINIRFTSVPQVLLSDQHRLRTLLNAGVARTGEEGSGLQRVWGRKEPRLWSQTR